MIHIVYCSFEEEGRNYIGVHSTEDVNDGYLGSFRDKTFKPTHKIILGYYKSREAALEREIQLHALFMVDKDESFANIAKQTSKKFDCSVYNDLLQSLAGTDAHPHKGKKRPPETGERISAAKLGKPQSEETKRKISENSRGERNSQWGKKGSAHHLHGKPWPEARRRSYELKKQNQS